MRHPGYDPRVLRRISVSLDEERFAKLARSESLGSPQLPGFELALERLFEA